MQDEREKSRNLLSEEQIMNLMYGGVPAKRKSMLIENRMDAILEEIITLKKKAKTLPITMRKLYSYKVVEIKRKQEEKKKIIPLVLRKRILIENSAYG